MKKQTTFLFIFIAVIAIKVSAQCSTDFLFPVKLGTTKYQAINSLNLIDNIIDLRFEDERIICKYRTHNCIIVSDHVVVLNFANNILYNMSIGIFFEPKNLKGCLENYTQILNSLKNEYPVSIDFISYNDTIHEEQIGEGYWFYESEKDTDKIYKASIEYGFEFEWKWNNLLGRNVESKNVASYRLSIEINN
jgi:uncharacterized protein YlxP (DUF503 family)